MTGTETLSEIKDYIGPLQYEIVESDDKSGRMKVRGRFQMAETRNANGRIYSSKLWERLLQDKDLSEALTSRRMLGEVEHPKDGVTNLSRVSHVVTGLTRKGDEIVGEAEVLNTPAGRIIQELFRSGVQVGISSRGRGTSSLRGGVEYVDENNFHLDTFDFVYKPSTPGAYPKLQESVLTGPYAKDSKMTDKLNELKRLEVRAMDILKEGSSSSLSRQELQSWFEEGIELEANADTILSNIEEGDDNFEYAKEVVEKVNEARALMTARMDTFYEQNDSDLDTRAGLAIAGLDQPDQTNESAKSGDSRFETLKKTLKEALEARDYYKNRFTEALEVLESDESDLMKRYNAAKKLGERLFERLEESGSNLTELTQDYKALEERYQAAVALVAGITERQDKSRLLKRIREAIEDAPELAKFTKSLKSCNSIDELEEKLEEYREALGLPVQDVNEVMETEVNFGAAIENEDDSFDETDEDLEDDDSDSESTLGENADLPPVGQAINESRDSEVLTSSLLEDNNDRGVSLTHRALKRFSGWK